MRPFCETRCGIVTVELFAPLSDMLVSVPLPSRRRTLPPNVSEVEFAGVRRNFPLPTMNVELAISSAENDVVALAPLVAAQPTVLLTLPANDEVSFVSLPTL